MSFNHRKARSPSKAEAKGKPKTATTSVFGNLFKRNKSKAHKIGEVLPTTQTERGHDFFDEAPPKAGGLFKGISPSRYMNTLNIGSPPTVPQRAPPREEYGKMKFQEGGDRYLLPPVEADDSGFDSSNYKRKEKAKSISKGKSASLKEIDANSMELEEDMLGEVDGIREKMEEFVEEIEDESYFSDNEENDFDDDFIADEKKRPRKNRKGKRAPPRENYGKMKFEEGGDRHLFPQLEIDSSGFDTKKYNQKNKLNNLTAEIESTYKHATVGTKEDIHRLIESALRSERKAPYARTKLMVVGEGRAGKTCTIKALLRKTFDEAETSTKGLQVQRVDASNWEEDDNNYLVEHLQSCIHVKDLQRAERRERGERVMRAEVAEERVEVTREEVKRYGENLVLQEEGEESKLSFSIWDFGGQRVFYTLHHLFLTEFGCYVLCFDATKLSKEETRDSSVNFLQFWLYSKKLHAARAPVLLVGTHCDLLSAEELAEVEEVVSSRVLGTESFGEVGHESCCFLAIDNRSGRGVEALRLEIERTVRRQEYIKEEVPLSFVRTLELLLKEEAEFLKLSQVEHVMEVCGLSRELIPVALTFLARRGLVTYFPEHETLRRFLVLQPQWLVDAITDVVFDGKEHKAPAFDSKFSRDFRKFQKERVLSKCLLENIWTLKKYEEEVQKFLIRVMRESSLMCEYNFDNSNRKSTHFLVPSCFSTSYDSISRDDDNYSGPFFLIDFSSIYDSALAFKDEDSFVKYMPYGFFERLVCLCVELSATYCDSMKPELGEGVARLSFGVEVDFQMTVERDEEGLWRRIRVSTDEGTEMKEVSALLTKLHSMVEGLRVDFFGKYSDVSQLAVNILLPSSAETGRELATCTLIKHYRNKHSDRRVKLRPSKTRRKKLRLDAFDEWPLGESAATGEQVEDLDAILNPDAEFLQLKQQDSTLGNVAVKATSSLPPKLKYHCFLSYKQSSAIDMVGKQYYILSSLGYKCWYDQQFRGEINLENMRKGVEESMCYVLFLSKDVFPSRYIEEEVKMAVKLKKPIIFLHHPDTGTLGYWQFGDYISNAPDIVKPLFAVVESIQLQRRHYLEEAVTQLVDRRLQEILSSHKE